MAGKLDPGFIAAPFYGQSSYDPIEAVRRAKFERYQAAMSKRKKLDEDLEKGLKDLTFEIKGWDDQQGFEEISGELENLRSQFIAINNQGMNLTRPTSLGEQKLSKAFRTALTDLKQKHDVWQVEKSTIDKVKEIALDQLKKPEEERDMDVAATYEAIKDWKDTKGGVIERSDKVNNLIVTKARPVDIGTYFADQIKNMLPGPDKTDFKPTIDADGRITIPSWEGMDPARVDRAMRKVVEGIKFAKPNIRNAIDRNYEIEKEVNPGLSKEEWIKKRFLPEYPVKKEVSVTGGRSGSGPIDWKMALPGKTSAGTYDTEKFKETKAFAVPSVSKGKPVAGEKENFYSAATIPLQGVFKQVFTMPNAVHSVDAETGLPAPQARSAANMVDNVSILPIASKDIRVQVGNKTRMFKAGEKIPTSVQRQLEKDNRMGDFIYDAFLTTLTNYKQVPEDVPEMWKGSGMEDLFDAIKSNASTTLTPWREAKRYVEAAATRAKVDLTPLGTFIDEYLSELNSMGSVFGDNVKEITYENIYNENPVNK